MSNKIYPIGVQNFESLRNAVQNLQDSLGDELPEFSRSLGLTESELCDKLRRHYDGYHFAPDTAGVYNPFSLLHAFKNREFGR